MPLAVPVQQEVARETLMPLFPKNWATHLLKGGGDVRYLEYGKGVQNGGG